MQKILVIAVTTFLFSSLKSQTIKKYEIANSGCSVYMFCAPGRFEESFSEDSSKVYNAECEKDAIHYGVICIKLEKSISDLDEAENMLASYLDYLKINFTIKSAVGYGKGNLLNNRPDTRGIVDYWKDDQNNEWKIKGWTDGKFIGVLYAYSKKEIEIKVDVFLNSFRLPGM